MNASPWVAASLLLLAATAHAHAHLTSSEPPEGSKGKAPEQIVLTFSEPARLTALTLQGEGAEPRKLTPPAAAAARVAIPVPALAAGQYTLTWRAAGSDGHITSGTVHFTIVGSDAAGRG